LTQQLNVQTPASSWHYEGNIIDLCRRPQTIFGQLAAHTVGGWLPGLLLFTLPMTVILSFFGVNLIPANLWFLPCLLLGIALGFAVDFLFSCFIIRMQNASWLAYSIREAITALLSGAVIPFDLVPGTLGNILRLLPFGSVAGAPLALCTGMNSALSVLPLQIFWNLLLWPLAILAFRKSREWMVSYGG
jgi:ABC-2 type transport system permease protein